VYTRIRVHRRYKAKYAPYTRPCTRPVHSRIHGPCTRPVHGSVNVRVHGPCTRPRTRPVVYMAGRPTGPCTRSQTARYGRVRPVTAVYTARSHPVHDSVYGRVRRPDRHVHTSTPQLKGRVRAMYTSVYSHVHVRVHDQYTVVYMAGRPTRPCINAGRDGTLRPWAVYTAVT